MTPVVVPVVDSPSELPEDRESSVASEINDPDSSGNCASEAMPKRKTASAGSHSRDRAGLHFTSQFILTPARIVVNFVPIVFIEPDFASSNAVLLVLILDSLQDVLH